MKLFTKSIDQQLFKQFSMGSSMNQKVVVKIFNPYGRGYWYILNSDPDDPDYLWAIVDYGQGIETGSVSRRQLETMRVKPFMLPLERDLGFSPRPAKDIFEGLKQGKHFEEGGEVEGEGHENKEMLENQSSAITHHAKELSDVVKKTKEVEPWVITKTQRASTDLSDVTHYLEGEKKGKYAHGGNITNSMRGEEDDEYGTFEVMKRGGKVEVKIVKEGESYSPERYNWLMGDYDSDGIKNSDDKDPQNSLIAEKIDSPSLSSSMDYLLNLKNSMDENMYSFVDDLKSIAPENSKIYARTKTPYSILNKLVTKRLMNPKTGLTDLIGTTIVTSTKSELDKVKDVVNSGKMGNVIEFEDMYANPKGGYRAYHFLVERGGMPVEVQLKTKRQKAINELSHEPYKLKRLDSDKLLEISKIADEADRGNKASIRAYNDFMNQPNLENVFLLEEGGMMSHGGTINDVKDLEGHYVKVYILGVKEPKISTIESARIDDPMYRHRYVRLQFANGSEEAIPLGKYDKFLRGEKVELSDGEEPYMLQLVKSKSSGGKMASGGMMAKGGSVRYTSKNDKNYTSGQYPYYKRFPKAIGSFGWFYPLTKIHEGIIYPLDEFDNDYYSHLKLKDGEYLLRYRTDRMKTAHLIKFNFEKSLIYFLSDVNDEDDKNPKFESKGIKANYIVIEWDSLNHKMASGGMMAEGGAIKRKTKKEKEEESRMRRMRKRYYVTIYHGGEMPKEVKIFENLVDARNAARSGEHSTILDLLTNEEVFAKGGMMAKGGATFADKVSAIKSRLKGTKVPSRLKKDYGKRYNADESEMAAKRIAGAMRKKEM